MYSFFPSLQSIESRVGIVFFFFWVEFGHVFESLNDKFISAKETFLIFRVDPTVWDIDAICINACKKESGCANMLNLRLKVPSCGWSGIMHRIWIPTIICQLKVWCQCILFNLIFIGYLNNTLFNLTLHGYHDNCLCILHIKISKIKSL